MVYIWFRDKTFTTAVCFCLPSHLLYDNSKGLNHLFTIVEERNFWHFSMANLISVGFLDSCISC